MLKLIALIEALTSVVVTLKPSKIHTNRPKLKMAKVWAGRNIGDCTFFRHQSGDWVHAGEACKCAEHNAEYFYQKPIKEDELRDALDASRRNADATEAELAILSSKPADQRSEDDQAKIAAAEKSAKWAAEHFAEFQKNFEKDLAEAKAADMDIKTAEKAAKAVRDKFAEKVAPVLEGLRKEHLGTRVPVKARINLETVSAA